MTDEILGDYRQRIDASRDKYVGQLMEAIGKFEDSEGRRKEQLQLPGKSQLAAPDRSANALGHPPSQAQNPQLDLVPVYRKAIYGIREIAQMAISTDFYDLKEESEENFDGAKTEAPDFVSKTQQICMNNSEQLAIQIAKRDQAMMDLVRGTGLPVEYAFAREIPSVKTDVEHMLKAPASADSGAAGSEHKSPAHSAALNPNVEKMIDFYFVELRKFQAYLQTAKIEVEQEVHDAQHLSQAPTRQTELQFLQACVAILSARLTSYIQFRTEPNDIAAYK